MDGGHTGPLLEGMRADQRKQKKPRTYRKTARKRFLNVNKWEKDHKKDTERNKIPVELYQEKPWTYQEI